MSAEGIGPYFEPVFAGKAYNARPLAPAAMLRNAWYPSFKRLLDIVATLLLALPAAPLMLIALLAVRLTSRGPALFSQIRLGLHGRPFRIFKIRSMFHDCERLSGARWSAPGDSRVTPVGRFLRRTHIDELPQLWNVLRGDMSLVGPRPERPEFVPNLEAAIPRYRERMLVRPGVTGLAQVQLPPDTDVNSVRRKLSYDLIYLEQLNVWLDCRILLATLCYVFHLPILGVLHLPAGRLAETDVRTPVTPVPVVNNGDCIDIRAGLRNQVSSS